jgi:hypothetical protein
LIRVGKGEVGKNEILRWQDPDPDLSVQYIGLR